MCDGERRTFDAIYSSTAHPTPQKIAPGPTALSSPSRLPLPDNAIFSVVVGMVCAIGLVAAGVLIFKTYGLIVFVISPIVSGALATYVYNGRLRRSTGRSIVAAGCTVFAGLSGMLITGFEGILCLAMSMPLILVLPLLGCSIGLGIVDARLEGRSQARGNLYLLVLVLPIVCGMEGKLLKPELRVVESSIDIQAPADVVWQNVIGFPRLPEPTELLFKTGVAYPTRARIDGTGVGAIRYCEFSTGAFVEPITVWEPGKHLAFDVTEQPEPMREWSPYTIHPPHLDGALRSERGEFILEPLANGGTRLIGHTWYRIDMFPQAYWQVWCDGIIHGIHRRVLQHIKQECERPTSAGSRPNRQTRTR
jgi:hypothetical protein